MVNETTPGLTQERKNNQGESALGREKREPGLGGKDGSLTACAPPARITQAPTLMLIACVVNRRQRAGPRTHAQRGGAQMIYPGLQVVVFVLA